MIQVQIGDMFTDATGTITNTINCVGVMGKGLALEFKKRYPSMYKDYRERCRRGLVRPGQPYVYRELGEPGILMFPTKRHWRQESRLEDIVDGLRSVAKHYQEWGILQLALPPLGCGNGGLQWRVVAPVIYRELHLLPIPIVLYAPPDTPSAELSLSFLQTGGSSAPSRPDSLPPACYVIPEVLYRLAKNPCVKPVGHIIFQKICYILTKLGLDADMDFSKAAYGPFSPDAKKLLQQLTHLQMVEETPLGHNMIRISCTYSYSQQRKNLMPIFERYRDMIDRTVDLFSRIRHSEHAEMIASILYAAQELKQQHTPDSVSEWDVFHYVLQWKPHWDTPESRTHIADNIRGLQMLRWLKLCYCEGFFREEWEL